LQLISEYKKLAYHREKARQLRMSFYAGKLIVQIIEHCIWSQWCKTRSPKVVWIL